MKTNTATNTQKTTSEAQWKESKNDVVMLQVNVNKRDAKGKFVGNKTPDGNYLNLELCSGPFKNCEVSVIVDLDGDLNKTIRGLKTVLTSMIATSMAI